MKKEILISVISLIVGVLVGYVLHSNLSFGLTNNPAGTTFNSAKLAQVNITPSTGTATSSSILNTDATDRYIVSSFIGCNTVGTSKTAYSGSGLASFVWRIATTATAITGALADSNTNYIAVDTLSTSTVDSFVSSTTEGVITGTSRVWPTGINLTIQPNATNTAVCTAGVYYIGS